MARGLSTAELNTIRDTLAAGRRPKVVFTEAAGQVAGQTGQVTGLTDPALSDEWVVVRFGRDELPFSPTDLAMPPKGGLAARRPAKRLPPAEPPAPEFKVIREIPGQRADEPAAAGDARPAGGPTGGDVASGNGTGKGKADGAATGAGTDATGGGGAAAGGGPAEPGRAARKPARGKARPAPGLTVTLAYAEGEWTVAAQQGSRALAKPYVIRATEALKMVGMLDVAGVHEAVEQIVAAERAEAEAQAQRLREQLAELEARLADLREAH